jgi:hypothetical protein
MKSAFQNNLVEVSRRRQTSSLRDALTACSFCQHCSQLNNTAAAKQFTVIGFLCGHPGTFRDDKERRKCHHLTKAREQKKGRKKDAVRGLFASSLVLPKSMQAFW